MKKKRFLINKLVCLSLHTLITEPSDKASLMIDD